MPCELMNPDGTMTSGAEVADDAKRRGLVVLTIEEVVQLRRRMQPGT